CCSTLQSGASGASDAMDKVFRHLRQIVVDHVRHIIDVQTPRSDVSRHQHLKASFLESVQRAITLGLGAVAVNHCGGESISHQLLSQSLGSAFGSREYKR